MTRKIVFIEKSPFAVGGGPNYLRAHMRAAARLGFEPHAFSVAPRRETFVTDYGTVHHVLSPFRPYRAVTAALNVPLLARAVTGFVRANPGAVAVHGMHIYASAAVLARDAQREPARPRAIAGVFTTVRDESRSKREATIGAHGALNRAWYRLDDLVVASSVVPLERRAYRAADLVIVNYESVRRRFVETHGRRPGVVKLPYAPEADFLPTRNPAVAPPPWDTPGTTPRILCASRHDPRKGVHVLIESLALLRRRGLDFHAVFTGDGVLLPSHRELAQCRGLRGSATFTGAVPDPTAFTAVTDIFVLPSLQEGSGSIAVLEAMRAGVAIVASACDGLVEDIQHGVNGLLVAPGDARALAGALEHLLTNPVRRTELGRQAHATSASRFSAAQMVTALGAAYASIGVTP